MTNTEKWQQAAKAFLARTRKELWGKAGPNTQVQLYHMGFSVNESLDALLGWNPHPMKRTSDKWGLTGDPLVLPPGIVVPWVKDTEIRRLSIYLCEGDRQGEICLVPGSDRGPRITGVDNPAVVVVAGDLAGLRVELAAAGRADLVVLPYADADAARDDAVRMRVQQADTCLVFGNEALCRNLEAATGRVLDKGREPIFTDDGVGNAGISLLNAWLSANSRTGLEAVM
ncbi:MAG: hypothetical protein CSA22_09820 [Deltaproteobacteria bacterium]|nr:MAG: hypothetical protein CSA22_09820 [Deltaproteobacteria bacterium]